MTCAAAVTRLKLVRGYAYLAARSMDWQPPTRACSRHYYHHILLELEAQVDTGAERVLNIGALVVKATRTWLDASLESADEFLQNWPRSRHYGGREGYFERAGL